MAPKLVLNYIGRGHRLIRRGQSDIVIGFPDFVPGELKPLGIYDTAEGDRNVGPRFATTAFTSANHDPANGVTYSGGDAILGAGAVLVGKEVFGRVLFTGQATVTDCIIHGQTVGASAQDSAVCGWNAGTGKLAYNLSNSTLDHCRIQITSNKGFTNGIDGGNYVFKFGENYGGVDAFGFNYVGGLGRVWASRMSRAYYTSWWNTAGGAVRTASYTDADGVVWNPPFPGQSSGDTHADCVQLTQGNGYELIGCNMGGTRNVPYAQHWDPTVSADQAKIAAIRTSTEYTFSMIQVSSVNGSPAVGILAEKNWVQGGSATYNMADKSYDHMAGVIIRNNIHYRSLIVSTGTTNYNYAAYLQNTALPIGTTASTTGPGTNLSTVTGNTWADTGLPITITYWNK